MSDNAIGQRIEQFDWCIQHVAAELGVCCGGVDSSPQQQLSDPYSTTRVLLDAIRSLKSNTAPPAQPGCAQGEHEPHELFCPHCNPCRHREKLNEYDAVLRGLCSFLGAGGYNETHAGLIEAKSADDKIRWGIDHIIEVERKRAGAQGVAAGLPSPNYGNYILDSHD